MITATEAAKLYQTTVSYVYKLASLHYWRRTKRGRSVLYNVEDVDRSLGKD